MSSAGTQFSYDALAVATGGEWLQGTPPQGGVRCVSTDTRDLPPHALFLALRGARFDGHAFAEQALTAGAAGLCLAQDADGALLRRLAEQSVPVLLVADTLRAYQDLARAHRRRFSRLPVIAITGSSGKTSTREIIAAALQPHFGKLLVTPDNENNQIGVPRCLLRLEPSHRAAVLELGTNQPGEIATLAAIAEPTIAVLCSIGPVHLERLGSLAGVATEKAGIFQGLAAANGAAVVNQQCLQYEAVQAAVADVTLRTYGAGDAKGADYRGTNRTLDKGRSELYLRRRETDPPLRVIWDLYGSHQGGNAAAAYAVAEWLNVPLDTFCTGLRQARLPGMRMKLIEQHGVRWLNDAYNANPDSMAALFQTLRSAPPWPDCGSLYLVLGDMLELGEHSHHWHRQTLQRARELLPEATLLPVGERMGAAAEEEGIASFGSRDEVYAYLAAVVRTGDVVVLKGSRGMALERLLDLHAQRETP